MAWLVLVLSAVLEAVWASALGASRGFTDPGATTLFLVALLASMLGLARAARTIPIGTAYAVWTGIGAALTVIWAMATGTEAITLGKVVFLTGIVGAVVGLKLLPADPRAPGGSQAQGAAGGS